MKPVELSKKETTETNDFINKTLQKLVIDIDQIKPVVKEIEDLVDSSNQFYDEVSKKIQKVAFKDYENVDNPKATIRSLTFDT